MQQVCPQTLLPTSTPFLFFFLPHFFFNGPLFYYRLHFSGSRILGDGIKCSWVVEQEFSWQFLAEHYVVFLPLSAASLTELFWILAWFERSHPPAQIRWQMCPWTLKLMTSQVDQNGWLWVVQGWMGYQSIIFNACYLVLLEETMVKVSICLKWEYNMYPGSKKSFNCILYTTLTQPKWANLQVFIRGVAGVIQFKVIKIHWKSQTSLMKNF